MNTKHFKHEHEHPVACTGFMVTAMFSLEQVTANVRDGSWKVGKGDWALLRTHSADDCAAMQLEFDAASFNSSIPKCGSMC